MANVSGMEHEFRGGGESIDLVDGRFQRRGYVRIGRFVEPHVAVADLHEAQTALDRFRIHFREAAHTVGLQNTALHNAEGASSRPGHALQESAAVDAIMVM